MMRFNELPFAKIAEAMRVDETHLQDQLYESVDRVLTTGSDGFLQFSCCFNSSREEMLPNGTGLSVVPRYYHDDSGQEVKGALVTLSIPWNEDWMNEEWMVTLPQGNYGS